MVKKSVLRQIRDAGRALFFLSPGYEILGEIVCSSMDRQESNEMAIQHWSS
jgi:hypothetical protein